MRVFKLVIEIRITCIQRYGINIILKKDETKSLREPHNKFDKNAIMVKLGDNKIGYLKRGEPAMLSPILSTNKI